MLQCLEKLAVVHAEVVDHEDLEGCDASFDTPVHGHKHFTAGDVTNAYMIGIIDGRTVRPAECIAPVQRCVHGFADALEHEVEYGCCASACGGPGACEIVIS